MNFNFLTMLNGGIWLALLGPLACGPNEAEDSTNASSSGASSGDARPGDETTAAVVTTSDTATNDTRHCEETDGCESTGEPFTCEQRAEMMATALKSGPRCELLVHLEGAVVMEWIYSCGEVPAMPVYTGETAPGATSCCYEQGQLVGPDESPFIIHKLPASPDPGGLAIVSNHLGARIFDEEIETAKPSLIHPLAWQSAESAGVGEGCSAPFTLDAASFDLRADPLAPPPLAADVLASLSDAIAGSVIPTALQAVTVDRTVVISYQEKIGTPEPAVLIMFELSSG